MNIGWFLERRRQVGGYIEGSREQVVIDVLDYPVDPLLALARVEDPHALGVILVGTAPATCFILEGEHRVKLHLLELPCLRSVSLRQKLLIFERFIQDRIP